MKRLFALILALMLPLCAAVAEEKTPLPFGVDFQMDYATVKETLGEGVQEDDWGDETGMLTLTDVGAGYGDLKAEYVYFQIDRNNSAAASRLSQISMTILCDGNSIADFRAALAALTAAFGAPDSDPFSEEAVEYYVEYGNLSANWIKPDVRVNLSMSRMYGDSLSLDITNRILYDKADLAE